MKRRQFLALSLLNPVFGFANSQSNTGLVLDDGFLHHQISPAHPEKPARYQFIKQQLNANNLVNKTLSIEPIKGAEQWLTLVHSKQHIAKIKQQSETHKNAILATAGVLATVDAVCQGVVTNAKTTRTSRQEHRARRRLLLLQSYCHCCTICTATL